MRSMQGMPRFSAAYLCVCVAVLFIPRVAGASGFMDIDESHVYRDAILFLQQEEIVNGYPDKTFRPDRRVTRAEAVKIIVSLRGSDEGACSSVKDAFTDVSAEAWYARFVCMGLEEKIIERSDTKLFRPHDRLNVGEISAMLAREYELLLTGKTEPWYASSVEAMGEARALPAGIEAAGEYVTRGQLAEMLWRLERGVTDRPHADTERILSAQCDWVEEEDIPNVDDEEVTRAWMSWVNNERKENGLAPYAINKQLTKTATLWSNQARTAGAITHKRPGQTAYYDYKTMTGWFAGQNISFANVSRSTFTENIGWGVYRCNQADCTDKFINSIRTTFDFYMSEKGKAYRPHYNSIVNGEFTLAGLGIALDQASGKYYLTAHYGTDITSNPDPVCP